MVKVIGQSSRSRNKKFPFRLPLTYRAYLIVVEFSVLERSIQWRSEGRPIRAPIRAWPDRRRRSILRVTIQFLDLFNCAALTSSNRPFVRPAFNGERDLTIRYTCPKKITYLLTYLIDKPACCVRGFCCPVHCKLRWSVVHAVMYACRTTVADLAAKTKNKMVLFAVFSITNISTLLLCVGVRCITIKLSVSVWLYMSYLKNHMSKL